MSIKLVCLLVAFVAATNLIAVEAQCPEYNMNLWGADLDYIGNTQSWQACGDLCEQNPSCGCWSWYISEQTCVTKMYSDGSSGDKNSISGNKNCHS